ncbi:MAG: glycosyltransferase family 4 protein [Alphaproteobacteria bacterium]
MAQALPPRGQLVFDVTSLARWVGPAVGIVRAEHALASYALRRQPEIVLSFCDPQTRSFRALKREWAKIVIGWKGTTDFTHVDNRWQHSRLQKLLPSFYPAVAALERRRLAAKSSTAARAMEALQQLLLANRYLKRYLHLFADPHGGPHAVIPFDVAVDGALSLGPGDTMVSGGMDWYHKDIDMVGELKRRYGFRYVVLCYDILPMTSPEFFQPFAVEMVGKYWDKMFQLADGVIVNSRCIESDVRRYCEERGIRPGRIEVLRLGYDPPRARARAATSLPAGLEPGRFAMLVSTIEPRKGHGMLIDIWRRLLAEGVPQRHRFKLVFVGRLGWMVDDVLEQIADSASFNGTLIHLLGLSDAALADLYRGAAFCLYPSLYEGFGLPIIEAYSYGKAVIASTGGAIPEIAGPFSPCLEPRDPAVWYAAIRRWIEEPAARAAYEALIRARFAHPTWDEAAERIFGAVGALTALPR